MRRLLFIVIIPLLFFSCIRYSPYEVIVDEEDRNLNAKNLERLLKKDQSGDTMIFAFVGDTQRYYEEADKMVDIMNTMPEIEFLAISGDLSDFGLNAEFKAIATILKDLNIPFLAAIGNHDMVYNGTKVFEKMFGPLNFSFTYKNNRFVFLNTNSRESGFDGSVPNISFMDFHLSDTLNYKNAILVEHVPPGNDDFDPDLTQPYVNTAAKYGKTLLSMNGHNHDFAIGMPYNDGVTYFNSYSAGKGYFSVIKVWDGGFEYKNVSF